MKWTPDYATGIERIDSQHKMIFQMLEDYQITLEAGEGERIFGVFLDSLDLYCKGHFGYEERCMAERQCPQAEQNLAAHAAFNEQLAGFRERFRREGYSPAEAARLVETVAGWLSGHICAVDVHLRDVPAPQQR
ncbi:MAG: hemerythrin family protein [Planctomycetes bacterium]|nr:hemerythrin family protein [Planctomycetota bacterium]